MNQLKAQADHPKPVYDLYPVQKVMLAGSMLSMGAAKLAERLELERPAKVLLGTAAVAAAAVVLSPWHRQKPAIQ